MEHSPISHIAKLMNPRNVKLPLIAPDLPNRLDFEEPAERYHANRDTISSGGLKKVLRSPKHYLSWLLGLEEDEEGEKDHFRFGRAAHMMLLEPRKFRDLYVVEPEFVGYTKDGKESKNSKEAKDKRAKWREDQHPDAQIITQDEQKHLIGMIESVMEHSIARNLLVDGRPEVSGYFKDPDTGIYCRIRPDYLSLDKDNGGTHLVDFKTSRDVRAGMFSNDIWRMLYHLQMAFYYDGLTAINGKQPESASFIVVEKTPPYECAVYVADDQMLAMGRQWYQHGLRLLKRCIETNQWPGVQLQAQMISLPKRAEYDQFPEFEFG